MAIPANWSWQHTLARPSSVVRGVGLHSGRPVTLRLKPADSGSGLVFWRRDLGPDARIRCQASAVVDTLLSTCVAARDARAETIEHLLSALWAAGVDNALIEISAPELPSMDGSARPFLLLLRDSGLRRQNARRLVRLVRQKVSAEFEERGELRVASYLPHPSCLWDLRVSYLQSFIRAAGQNLSFAYGDDYEREIAGARTFGFIGTLDMMRRQRRALGGSIDNALVIDGARIVNPEGLRYTNEIVRHKMLDAIGDCYIGGHLVLGRYQASKPGHRLNNMLMRKLEEPGVAELLEADDDLLQAVRPTA